mmetsp:Transcript_19227/g.57778  ORF Transcript_19227/g.57778 Transcript_19227/m.57778 type:complete len:450 (-) Transcript_19227:149-1498(-)
MGCATSVQQADHVVIDTHQAAPYSWSRQTSNEKDAALNYMVGKPAGEGSPHSVESLSFHEKYLVGEKLGKGAFAHVYLVMKADGVEKPSSKAVPMAVKISDLRPHDGHSDVRDAKASCAAEREAAILHRVKEAEYCVKVYDVFLEGFLSYIVMERCDMPLIQALDREVSVKEKTFTRYIREMLQGLTQIHDLRVAHRDIKPDNFLCTGPRLTVKLCDFGLAEVVSRTHENCLKGVYGTAPFMAPEILGGGYYGMKVDLWSVGVIMYVVMLGHFPYQPAEATPKAMKAAILSGFPEPTFVAKKSTFCSPLSPDAMDILHTLLTRDAAQRPKAAEVLTMDWLQPGMVFDDEYSGSLRPCLAAAKRAGAFDMRKPKNLQNCELDGIIQEQQRKHHSNDDLPRKGAYNTSMSSGSSTRAGSRASHRDPAHSRDTSRGESEQSDTRKMADYRRN